MKLMSLSWKYKRFRWTLLNSFLLLFFYWFLFFLLLLLFFNYLFDDMVFFLLNLSEELFLWLFVWWKLLLLLVFLRWWVIFSIDWISQWMIFTDFPCISTIGVIYNLTKMQFSFKFILLSAIITKWNLLSQWLNSLQVFLDIHLSLFIDRESLDVLNKLSYCLCSIILQYSHSIIHLNIKHKCTYWYINLLLIPLIWLRKWYLRTLAMHILTLVTLSLTRLSISSLKCLSNKSFLFMASPHIKTNKYLFLKVLER